MAFIKGKVQKQFAKPVLPEVPASADNDISMVSSSAVQNEGGSSFKGFSAPVNNINDVARIRKFIVQRPDVTAATHVVFAYRYEGSSGQVTENFDSDRDWYCGLELLNHMKQLEIVNSLWIAIRTCSRDFSHIGRRRFEIMNTLCSQAQDQ